MNESDESRITRLEERLRATEKAVELARVGIEKRLEGMNEFRETLKDQASRFVTRSDLCGAGITIITIAISIVMIIVKFQSN